MQFSMRSLYFALAALGSGIVIQPDAAQAREYPFCIQSRDTAGYGDCSYATYEDCRAAVSGRRGGCFANPWLAYREPVTPVRRHRRAYN
jgi:hypothetical protein